MNCFNCDTENRPGAKFCNECASPLPLPCPACGAMNRPAARFCDQCAVSLTSQPLAPALPQGTPQPTIQARSTTETAPPPSEPQVPEAERRQLTVMFCDLVGSTNLSGQLDPEELRDIIRAYQAASSEVIQPFEGYVAQHLGDGLLIYFGYPAAHEDDAQRAVRSGLGIIDAMGALNERLAQTHGIQLAVRIGIHTGLVVIGDIGTGPRQEQLALGETPNVAARIQGLAEPDTVVISDVTYRLVEGYFDCDTWGERALKGVADPVKVYRVLRLSGMQDRLDTARTRGLTQLVGREQEIDLLLERWGQVKSGHGQVIVVRGEPGIGKSRLSQVLREQIANEPHTRLECRSSPYYENTALYSVIDLLQRSLGGQTTSTPEERFQKLETTLGQYRWPLDEAVPLVAVLLSLPVPVDRYIPLNLTPQHQRQKTFEVLLAILLELAEQQPLLFILEDLHWTDPTTLAFLELVIDQVPTSSMLLLLTTRPEFNVPWERRSHLAHMTLNRLSPKQIGEMAIRTLGDQELPVEVIEQIVEKTDGIPLFVEEFTKSAIASGVLKKIDGHYELARPLSAVAIPVTLQDALMARLDRLGPAKHVAQLGATIGREFSGSLLKRIAPETPEVVKGALNQLVEAEILDQLDASSQDHYMFRHALIQDTAYQSQLRRTRQDVHAQIVHALPDQFPGIAETQPELL